MSKYPEDEFDRAAEGVPEGVHRAPEPWWRGLLPYLVVIVTVPLIAWAGVAILSKLGGSEATQPQNAPSAVQPGVQAPAPVETTEAPAPETQETTEAPTEAPAEPTETPTPAEEPADMNVAVVVYNSTEIQGLAGRKVEKLKEAGFPNAEAKNFEGQAPSGNVVYYSGAANAAEAKAVGAALGIAELVDDAGAAQSAPVVVVLVSE
ncbi:MAG: LytR C-terminal domain-containing protein [Buchananella hordeovulneris]|nr:LytR C-terminal domain-containing protein [Buchananella hordeovulneris]